MLAALLFTPIHAIFLAAGLLDDVPSQDELSYFVYDKIGHGLNLTNLFAFLNEHQIVFTRLAIYCDYKFFHGTNLLPCLVNALLLAGVWCVYSAELRRAGSGFSRNEYVLLCGLLLTLYFNGRMLENLTFSVMEFPWTAFLAACAFSLFSRLPEQIARPGKRIRSLTVLAAVLVAAALSCAGGLLTGPSMLVVLAALLLYSPSIPKKPLLKTGAVLLAVTCVIVGVYVGAFRAVSGAFGKHPVFDPSAIASFVYVFVGGPWFNDSEWPIVAHASPMLLYSVCASFWALLAWLAIQLFKRRDRITAFELFHACAIVFVVLTALSGSALRSDLSPMEGVSKKYTPIALMAWLSAASLLAFYRPGMLFKGQRVRPAALAGGIALVLIIIPGDLLQYRMWRLWRAQLRQTAVAVASGVYDSDRLRRLYHRPEAGYAASREFAEQGEYCYRRMPTPGYNARERFQVNESDHAGALNAEVTAVRDRPGSEGYVAWGTSGDFSDAFPALLIADSDGRALGYGTMADISSDGTGRRTAEWFAAFQAPRAAGHSPLRIYRLRQHAASLWGQLELVGEEPEIDAARKAASVPLRRLADNNDFNLDTFNGVGAPTLHQTVHVARRGKLELAGWAVDRNASRPAAAVDILVDGRAFTAQTGRRRDDVSSYFHQPRFATSGYSIEIPAAAIGRGTHHLRVRIYVAAGASFVESPDYDFLIE